MDDTTPAAADDEGLSGSPRMAELSVGVYRRSELLADGLTDDLIMRDVRKGRLTRIRHGIYADARALAAASPAEAHKAHLRGAVLAAREPIWASGPSAAMLHGLPLFEAAPARIHLAREGRQDIRSLQRPSKHELTLPDIEIVTHAFPSPPDSLCAGLPTVDAATAAVTSAPHVGFWRLVGLLDAVRWRSSISQDHLESLAHEWMQLGSQGKCLEAIALSRSGAQTFLETYSRLALMRERLPEPLLQVPFYDAQGLIGIVDMYWPDFGVVGEADGAIKYDSRAVLIAEKKRAERLASLGLRMVRWMWADITQRPDLVAAQVRRSARQAA